jgi:hypothetical protein
MRRSTVAALSVSVTALLTTAALLWAFNNALAAVPHVPPAPSNVPSAISYQGRLVDHPTGEDVPDGVYNMTFRIYDVFTATIPIWIQEDVSVHIKDGLFTTQLGSHATPLGPEVFSGGSRWLGVQVGAGQEMTPRQPLLSVPYALRAETLRVGGMVSATSGSPLYRFVNGGPGPSLLLTNNGGGPALAANGDVHVGGDLTWDTRKSYISVSPATFEEYSPSSYYVKKGRSMYTTSGAHYYAALQLPHGAELTEMTFYYRDWTYVSPGVITMTLKRGPVDGTVDDHEDMAQVASQSPEPLYYGSGSDSVDHPVVDNQHYIYWLHALFHGPMNEDLRIMAVVIEYEIQEPY